MVNIFSKSDVNACISKTKLHCESVCVEQNHGSHAVMHKGGVAFTGESHTATETFF